MSRYFAVIPAAGLGRRMGTSLPKQYLPLLGKPLLQYVLDAFLHCEQVDKIVVALHPDDKWFAELEHAQHEKIETVQGGELRSDSVLNGLSVLEANNDDWVLAHDAARPCISQADLHTLFDKLVDHPVGGCLAAPVKDTLHRSDETFEVLDTIDRTGLWHAYTPQMFRFGVLQQALQQAHASNLRVTDDVMAVRALGKRIKLIPGRRDNIKITYADDISLAEFYLQRLKQD